MRSLLSPLPAAVMVVISVCSSLSAADAVELRWQFKKGQTFRYLLKHKAVRTIPVGDVTFETTTNTEYDWEWTVEEIDARGTATLGMKLTRLRLTTFGKDFDFEYDSAKANASDDEYKKRLINFYDQLRMAKYQFRLSQQGKVSDVRGFDKLLSEIDVSGGIADFHALNLHDDSFAWYLQQLLGTLPAAAAEKGKEWTEKVEMRLTDIGDLNGKAVFTLGDEVKEGDESCREVAFKSEQSLEMKMKWGNAELNGTLKIGKLDGKLCFDKKEGALKKSGVKAEMKGKLKLGDDPKAGVLNMTLQHQLELEAKR